MKFLVADTPAYRGTETPEIIEITTLEELLSYISEYDFDVILHQPNEGNGMWAIEFYTDYRE